MLSFQLLFQCNFNVRVSKNKGYPKMDGENHGSKPYEILMDDLGLFSPLFLETPILQTQTMHYYKVNSCKFFKLTTSWHCLIPTK